MTEDSTPPTDGGGEDESVDAALTRRDAMAALTAAGAATALGGSLGWAVLATGDDDEGFSDRERETLVALAEHLYPSAVSSVGDFVERYTVGRVRDRPEYAAGMRDALVALDDYALQWTEQRFVDLTPDRREVLLESMGVTVASPEPDGLDPERVRFYLVNELLFALYSTPTGGDLVGIENPQGHPGGTTSYREPPGR
ncbi:hypothetical protein BRC89_02940 [Halobacteriales archaeon QS_4_70_19]|nr:MAG: hypothetical protein BRC89_02940 [Halobacteriales archaeon QS_4_70_19]